MRDFLTGLAIVLIIVLTTVLVAPYFVDWTGQRSFLEARLGHALGQKVTIGGNIDLKLLPTPYLVLDQVVVGGDDGPIRVGVHHLDLELTVAPLLHGEFDVTEAKLIEPTVRLALAPGRTLPTLPTAPAFQADIRFDKIHVVDGTLAIEDPESGRDYVFDHLDLDADADSLSGPFKVEGSGGMPGRRTRFHLATAPPEKTGTHTRLVIEETAAHPALELDGAMILAKDGATAVSPHFIGKLTASGHLPQFGEMQAPWRLAGVVQADPDRAVLGNGELRLGGDDAALTLQAEATGTFGESAQLALDLSAKQLDIDRLAGPPTQTPQPPPRLPDLAGLRRLLVAARLSVPWSVALSVDKATWGGDTLSDLEAHIGFGHGTADPLKLDVDGPGDAHLALDGTLAAAADGRYDGRVAVTAADAHRTAAWLARVAPADSPAARAETSLRSVDIRSHVAVTAERLSATDLNAVLDQTTVRGTAALRFGDTSHAAQLTADLVAQKLDLDALPSLVDSSALAMPLDVDAKLDAGLVGGRLLGRDEGGGGRLTAHLIKRGDHLRFDDVRADHLGGADISGSAAIDPRHAALDASIDAQHLDGLANLLRGGLPGPAAGAVAARAATFAPAKAKLVVTLARSAENVPFKLSSLSIAGLLGATRIDAAMPAARSGEDAALDLTLDAPEAGPLLHQLGFETLPIDQIGRGHVVLKAKRSGAAYDTRLSGTLGQTEVKLDGRFRIGGSGRPDGAGTLRLMSGDIGPLMQTLAFALSDMTGRLPADVSGRFAVTPDGVQLTGASGHVSDISAKGDLAWKGDAGDAAQLTGRLDVAHLSAASLSGLVLGPTHDPGGGARWSREPFGEGLAAPPRTALHLSVETLDLAQGIVAHGATFDLGLSSGTLKLSALGAHVADGTLHGDVTVHRDGQQAGLEAKLAFDGLRVRLPALETTASGSLDLAGGGTSAATLAASLAGSGQAKLSATAIPGADASAFRRVFDEVEADTLSVDEDAVVRAWTDAAGGALRLPDDALGLDVASGVLHAASGELAREAPVHSALDIAYDVGRDQLVLGVKETLAALPKNWTGAPPSIAITFEGTPTAPRRTVDVATFLNAVAARALARETARIEAYEFDIRERAFFNTRLQADQRRTAERQKAADDARKAEAERKARLEAARIERQRKEDAAKAARDATKPHLDLNPDGTPADSKVAPPEPPHAPAPDPSTLGRY